MHLEDRQKPRWLILESTNPIYSNKREIPTMREMASSGSGNLSEWHQSFSQTCSSPHE